MSTNASVKTVLKRGALVAAANWQVTAIQFVADTTVNLLLTVPMVGGGLMVALVLGQALPDLSFADLRSSLTGVASVLMSEPIALVSFLLSLGVVGVAGSVLLFLTKGGTVAVLAEGERAAGPVEEPPLLLTTVATGSCFGLTRFQQGCTKYFRRFVRLGLVLMVVYAGSGAVYLGVLFGNLPAALTPESNTAWTVTAGIASTVLAIWVTLVNFAYLLIQMVVVVDDCGVRQASRRVVGFLRGQPRPVLSVFGLVVLLVVGATVISVVATTSLGLIAFVPFVGLAVVPLQLLAWLFRGIVFQFIGLSALSAYLHMYRRHLNPERELPSPMAPPHQSPFV
ncbi:MAG: hypothetical protein Q7V01_06015 [Vicinamibacterales bacterium]|nr:hypothetical protein [Vicinamibacterales bacterium]